MFSIMEQYALSGYTFLRLIYYFFFLSKTVDFRRRFSYNLCRLAKQREGHM